MYKCFYRWREITILSLLYSICKGLNSFFSSETQKKILSNDMSENMSVVFFSVINSLDTQTRLWIDGVWNWPKFTSVLKYFCLSSRCTARYTLVCTHARMTIWGAQNVRCTIVCAKMLLHEETCTKISNFWSPDLLPLCIFSILHWFNKDPSYLSEV